MTNRFFVWQKKRILFMLLCSLIMALCCFQTAFAASGQVVRVGYYERPGFQEGVGPNERKSGYAYEYLQKVSDYTGWKYRYIYKDLDTLKQMMDKGEVDLIAGFSRHDDIPKQAEFADEPFGTETCYIYKRADDDSIKPGYIVGLIGKRIGVVYKAPAAAYLKKFMQDKAFSCQVVTYGSAGELVKALKAGKIDAFAAKDLNVGNISEIVPCLSISRDDFYVCVLSGKRTVLRELNEADMRLRNVEPYFLNQLYFKYYQNVSASVMQSNEEASWLLVHNKLRIGYLKNYMPYCGMDEKGNVTGLLKDYIESLRSEPELAGLVIEAVPYDNLSMAYADLNQKKINAIFPYYGDTWYAEMTNVRKSVTVFSQTVDLIFDGTYSDEVMNTVVLSTTNSVLKGYIEKFYPDSKVIEVSSNDECIAAVKSGRATSTIMNRYKTSRYLHKTANQSLHSTGLPNLCNISFVVRSTDVELLSLLNRGILVMGDKKIDSSVNRYIYYDYDYSWSNFVAEHMQESILLVSCFIAFLLAIFIFYINSTRRNQRRMELAQSEIQKARDLLAGALEKAEFANASKSTFLFNMSHDIRTPMNAILGFADLLEKYDDEPKKRREYVANIRTAGGYLLSLINEVLEMARIESGKVSLNEEAGNFLDMIDSLHVVLSEGYEKKNLQITRNINIQHPHVFYDFTKERAIFLNIMSNSLKYTPEGGRISLCIEELPGADDDYVVFRSVIQDTGIGMAKDFLPHIFESFSRERSATESRVTGTGLGMGIVKKYVDLMQGSIAVESEVGKGTTITLEIPHRIVHEAVASPDEQEVDYSVLQGKSVLLAEDNELNREIAEELLKDAGMSVRSAADGIECISILTAEMPGTFDFILMDLQMPNMDGLKATAAIREIEDKSKASIPIIAMTANVFDADRKRAFAAGMDGFTGKPIQLEELKRELVRVLSENSQD